MRNEFFTDEPEHSTLETAYALAEQFLFAQGVSRSNGRLQAYRGFISSLSSNPSGIPDLLHHIRMWREVHELVWVVTVFRNSAIVAPPGTFARALDGLPIEDYEHEHGRNLFLELRAAIYFSLAGYVVALNDDCDIVALRGRTRVFVECKRLYSPRKARTRMLEAYTQLEKRLSSARGLYRNIGFAWLDPSPAMQRTFVAYSTYSQDGALSAARADLYAFWKEHLARAYSGPEKRIAGVVLQMIWPAWTDGNTRIFTGFSTQAFPGNARLSLFVGRSLYRLMQELVKIEERGCIGALVSASGT